MPPPRPPPLVQPTLLRSSSRFGVDQRASRPTVYPSARRLRLDVPLAVLLVVSQGLVYHLCAPWPLTMPGTRLPAYGTLAYTTSHVAATAAAVAARVAATSFAVSRLSPDPPSGEAQPVVEATPPSNNSSHSLLLLVVPRCTPELTASDNVFARTRRRRWHRQLLALKRARKEVGSAANRYADGEIYV